MKRKNIYKHVALRFKIIALTVILLLPLFSFTVTSADYIISEAVADSIAPILANTVSDGNIIVTAEPTTEPKTITSTPTDGNTLEDTTEPETTIPEDYLETTTQTTATTNEENPTQTINNDDTSETSTSPQTDENTDNPQTTTPEDDLETTPQTTTTTNEESPTETITESQITTQTINNDGTIQQIAPVRRISRTTAVASDTVPINPSPPPSTNTSPIAHIIATPTNAYVGDVITFDGSNSVDNGRDNDGNNGGHNLIPVNRIGVSATHSTLYMNPVDESEYPADYDEYPSDDDGSPSSDGSIVSYKWDFGDGNIIVTAEPTTEHIYSNANIYTVILTVTDDDGNTDYDEAVVTIGDPNIPPVADAGDGYFQWIDPIIFNASNSIDPDGCIIGYRWDFDGDEQFDTEWSDVSTISHWYDVPGTYTVILEVMDNQSATGSDTTIAIVVDDNKLPVADAGGPYDGTVNESIMFNGSKSYDPDPDGTITNYTWDFGDGSIGYGVTTRHVYTKNGTFVVELTVRDNRGGINISSTYAEIKNENENRAPSKPEVTIKESGNKNEYILTAVSTDPEGNMIKYITYWDDDTDGESPYFPSRTALTTSHIYVVEGKYNITVYAEDEFGAKSEETIITIEVNESIGNTFYNQLNQGPDSLSEDMQYAILLGILSTIGFVFVGVFLYKKRNYSL